MIVFPMQMEEREYEKTVSYKAKDPTGSKLSNDRELMLSAAQGLFAVDYPLERFDTWLSASDPVLSGDELLLKGSAATTEALGCADAAAIPRIVSYEAERKESKSKDGKSSVSTSISLGMELMVFQREDGRLQLSDELSTKVPGVVDMVEDVMVQARAATLDNLKQQVPLADKAVDKAAELEALLEQLPLEQSQAVASALHNVRLSVNRVASIARPAMMVPMLEAGSHPGALGLAWRAVEDLCYLDTPNKEDDGSNYERRETECEALKRARQAVRQLQLETRKVDEFRLYGPLAAWSGEGKAARHGAFPLGVEEGVRVGDGFWMKRDGDRAGYARVRSRGVGGLEGEADPSRVQVVYGSTPGETAMVAQENPQLGIEVGGMFGYTAADRPAAGLPPDPQGGERSIEEGKGALGFDLRFDVNLGRTVGWYEWYETNRIQRSFAGELALYQTAFGVEKRFLLLPRTYLAGGAAFGMQIWSVPSGKAYTDDDGEDHEISASAIRFGGVANVGMVLMLHPSVMLRAEVGGRLFGGVDEFTWKNDNHSEKEGTVVPDAAKGSFHLRTTGLAAGASAVWVF